MDKSNDDELKKKIEEFNEARLESTAITFTSEGISNDIKEIIRMKSILNTKVMGHLSSILSNLTKSDKKTLDFLFNNSSPLYKIFTNLNEELTNTNQLMNFIINSLIVEEQSLKEVMEKVTKSNSKIVKDFKKDKNQYKDPTKE